MAARYAFKGIDPHEVGEVVLGRLAIYLTEQGDFVHAMEFYEKAIEAAQPGRRCGRCPSSCSVHQWRGRRRRFHATGTRASLPSRAEACKGRRAIRRVNQALDHPDRFGIDQQTREHLLGKQPSECYEMFGEAFLLAGRFPEAEAAFRKADAAVPNEAVLKFNLARVAAGRNQAEEALAGLQPYFDRGLTSEGSAPYQLLADVLKKLGKEGQLLDRLEKLHAAAPSNAPLSYFLAEQYLKAGRTDKAEPIFLDLSVKIPTFLAYRSLAEIYRKGRQYEKLLALLSKVMATAGTLEVLGSEAKPLTADADLFAHLVEAGRKRARRCHEGRIR